MDAAEQQTQLASFMGRLLRDHFGKGPESVFVSMGHGFISVYMRGFISPIEKVLLAKQQEAMLQTTRDIVMQTLIPEMKAYISIVTGRELREFYYDWGLHNRSAVFVGIYSEQEDQDIPEEEYPGKSLVHQEINAISKQAEKFPEEISSYLINSRTLIVVRKGILVAIEKQLIRQGLQEQLKTAKRVLEKQMLHNNHFESILQTKIKDIFVDWNFEMDKSLIVFCY
ncbi:MAG: hypothetical protein K0S39_3102 [Paenibacillus sp.]|jgi:uncharacterized protein YbcI|nr:hypothetical protein [Paenibacillus sp.]